MNARISVSIGFALVAFSFSGCGENPAANVTPAVVTPAPGTSSDPIANLKTKPAETKPADAKPADAKPADTKPAEAPKAGEPAKTTEAPKSAAAPAPAAGATLAISGEGSKIDFIGSKTVGGSHKGGFKTWTGTVDLTADKASVAKISVDIDTNSIWSDDEKLTAHLKNHDFFEVTKYPKATFATTEIKAGGEKGATHTLVGSLTLHGVTKTIAIPATVKIADGGVTLVSEFSFKRSDFGMTFTGPGGVVRDEVVIKLDVKAASKKA